MSDLAHIHHVELLTPEPDASLAYFHDMLGMEIESREGQSVFLRGWGEYQPYSLKLTEAAASGIDHMALRATSPEALDRQVAAIEATGLGIGWHDGDHGHGRAYRFHDPDGHVMEVLWESDRYAPPEHLKPSLRNQPQRYTARGAAVKRLDHVNLLANDIAACRAFAVDTLGYRQYEGIRLDSGEETGAWLSLTIAAHELIYVKDARGAGGRLHHLAFWVDTREECLRAADIFLDAGVHIEAAPSRHAVAAGFFLYSFEPGGNRIEVTTGGYFVYEPDPEPVIWTEAERARGQAWGVKTVESFHYYGTPPTAEDREYALAAGVPRPRENRSSSGQDDAARRRIRSPVVPPVPAQRSPHMVNAVVTEIPLKLEPVTDDAFETSESTEAEREIVLARIAALFGSAEPRRAIFD